MAVNIAILIYESVAALDFVGPYEVFNASQLLGMAEHNFYTVAESDQAVSCQGGLRVLPDYAWSNAPKPDILVIPGNADPTAQTKDEALLAWISKTSKESEWTVGVCTGSAILAAAGLARGRKITSHWSLIETLKANPEITVLEKTRYVRDGNLLTSAGVSAGIDVSLWLIGQLYSPRHARDVQHLLEYYPAPPYAAEVGE